MKHLGKRIKPKKKKKVAEKGKNIKSCLNFSQSWKKIELWS